MQLYEHQEKPENTCRPPAPGRGETQEGFVLHEKLLAEYFTSVLSEVTVNMSWWMPVQQGH